MESYVRKGVEGKGGVKTCQNHPYAINEWPLRSEENGKRQGRWLHTRRQNLFDWNCVLVAGGHPVVTWERCV